MPLHLGKSLNRCYQLRIPIVDGFYNISIFFNRKSTFLLFRAEPDFSESQSRKIAGIKTTTFKNIGAAKFCETFLELHNFRNQNLDILNQFHRVKPACEDNVNLFINETLVLGKHNIGDGREISDKLTIYGFSLTPYIGEYAFIITERQHISVEFEKKFVRTSAIQIGTSRALRELDDFHQRSMTQTYDTTDRKVPLYT